MKKLLFIPFAALALFTAPVAVADNGYVDTGTYDELLDILDEDGTQTEFDDNDLQDMEGYNHCPGTWGSCAGDN